MWWDMVLWYDITLYIYTPITYYALILCDVMLWHCMMCSGMIWSDVLCYDMICHMRCYDVTWYVLWCDVLCYTISYDMICNDETMVWYCMMCYVTVWYVMIWHVMIWHWMVWRNHDIKCSDLVLYDKIWWHDMTLWVARPFPRQPLLVPVIRAGIPRGPPVFIKTSILRHLNGRKMTYPPTNLTRCIFQAIPKIVQNAKLSSN